MEDGSGLGIAYLIFTGLALVVTLMWIVFPIVTYTQLNRIKDILAGSAASQNQNLEDIEAALSRIEGGLRLIEGYVGEEFRQIQDEKSEVKTPKPVNKAKLEKLNRTLKQIDMSEEELAEKINRSPREVNRILSGQQPITADLAADLERGTGIAAAFWLKDA